MLSNNNKSSIHSTVVSTKCQGNKYHQLLHKMVSIINQLITVNMVSNKTIMPNKIIRMALNMEKARLDKDTKWMDTVHSNITKIKRISIWINLINRCNKTSRVFLKLSIALSRAPTYLIALIFIMKTRMWMVQCNMVRSMATWTIVDSKTIHIEMINLIWDISSNNNLIKIKDRITKEAMLVRALIISTIDEDDQIKWELIITHKFTQINSIIAGAWVEIKQ